MNKNWRRTRGLVVSSIVLAGCAQVLDIKDRELDETSAGNAGQAPTGGKQPVPNGGKGGTAGSSGGGNAGTGGTSEWIAGAGGAGFGGFSLGGNSGLGGEVETGKGGTSGGGSPPTSGGMDGLEGGSGGDPGSGGTGGAPRGGTSGTGGSGGAGGSGGTTVIKECTKASDCPTPSPALDQCMQLACDNGKCIAEAKPKTAACTSDSLSGLCNEGICVVCTPDTHICRTNDLYRCSTSGNGYQLAGHCAAGLCDAKAGACLGCAASTAWCSEDHTKRIECSANGQSKTETTKANQWCVDSGSWVDCVEDNHCPNVSLPACVQKACTNTNTCGTRPKTLGTACTAGSCDGSGNCLVCAAGQKRCTSARLERCNAARTGWELDATCSSAALCNEAEGRCNVCTPNSASCVDAHTRRQCSADGSQYLPNQVDNTKFCTGSGVWVNCRNANDCPQPANPCMQATCSNDTCGATTRAANAACAGNGACDGSGTCMGPTGGSCQGVSLTCQGVSCCQSRLVLGGSFPMGRGGSAASDACPANMTCSDQIERPEHTATVADFYMDTFEVTVGRFRQFFSKFDSIRPLSDGVGAHPRIASSGWKASSWNALLATSQTTLLNNIRCDANNQTWPSLPNGAATENRAINCVNWYEAFAFCAWDGGRLPTEAEWEYAAANGAANTLYPWGSGAPDNTRANDIDYPSRASTLQVGGFSAGKSTLGILDLSGSMEEWQLDLADTGWYAGAGNTCNNCANLSTGSVRATRGGSWATDLQLLRAVARSGGDPTSRTYYRGFRCVRDRGQ